MAFTYDPSNLTTTTATGRVNVVRLLIGDTDTTDQQLQDEEITFALSQSSDNVYYAGSFSCHYLAGKYSRLVDQRLGGTRGIQEQYSDLVQKYTALATTLEEHGKKFSGRNLGAAAGGISIAAMRANDSKSDRPSSSFEIGQFDYPGTEHTGSGLNYYFPIGPW